MTLLQSRDCPRNSHCSGEYDDFFTKTLRSTHIRADYLQKTVFIPRGICNRNWLTMILNVSRGNSVMNNDGRLMEFLPSGLRRFAIEKSKIKNQIKSIRRIDKSIDCHANISPSTGYIAPPPPQKKKKRRRRKKVD